jgi:hypothetical protein
MRQHTDCSHDYHRTSIHNNKNQNNIKNNIENKINPLDLLKNTNNLTIYEK